VFTFKETGKMFLQYYSLKFLNPETAKRVADAEMGDTFNEALTNKQTNKLILIGYTKS